MSRETEIILPLLREGGIFVGWEPCKGPRLRRLRVVRDPSEAGALVCDPLCAPSPVGVAAALARRGRERIGMFVRACEARSLIECFKSKQLDRGRLMLHGIRCEGVIDPRRLRELCRVLGRPEEVVSVRRAGGDFEIELRGGGPMRVPAAEVVLERCFACRAPRELRLDSSDEDAMRPVVFERPPSRRPDDEADTARLLSGCILCFACRSACSGCFCRECVFDVKLRKELTPWMFHVTRSMHLAGRCAECGECERVCPVGLPVQAIRRRLEKIIGDMNVKGGAGMSADDKVFMVDWSPED